MGNRLDQEIDEILSQYERQQGRAPVRLKTGRIARLRRRLARMRPSVSVGAVSPPQLMLGGAIVVLFGVFFGAFLPDAAEKWIIIAGASAAILGFFWSVISRRRPRTVEKRWRGQVIRIPDSDRPSRPRGWFRK